MGRPKVVTHSTLTLLYSGYLTVWPNMLSTEMCSKIQWHSAGKGLLLDVSILLLLTNRYNKGILLHFCQQNGKKIAKLKILTKPSGNGLKNILGQKKFFGA